MSTVSTLLTTLPTLALEIAPSKIVLLAQLQDSLASLALLTSPAPTIFVSTVMLPSVFSAVPIKVVHSAAMDFRSPTPLTEPSVFNAATSIVTVVLLLMFAPAASLDSLSWLPPPRAMLLVYSAMSQVA